MSCTRRKVTDIRLQPGIRNTRRLRSTTLDARAYRFEDGWCPFSDAGHQQPDHDDPNEETAGYGDSWIGSCGLHDIAARVSVRILGRLLISEQVSYVCMQHRRLSAETDCLSLSLGLDGLCCYPHPKCVIATHAEGEGSAFNSLLSDWFGLFRLPRGGRPSYLGKQLAFDLDTTIRLMTVSMSPIASSSRSAIRALPRAVVRRTAPYARLAQSAFVPTPAVSNCATPISPRSRSFFSLPDISKLASSLTGSTPNEGENESGRGVETDGEMQMFHARKILP